MSLIADGVTVIELGETLIGTDEGREVNVRMEGRECYVSHNDPLNNSGLVSKPIGVRTKLRVFRNSTGDALLPGETFVIDPAAGIAGMARASAKAGATAVHAYTVDPLLPAAGVADGDLFLGCVEGPTKVKAPAGGLSLSVDGAAITTGASGRIAVAAATAGTDRTILGWLLADDTNLTANQMVEVNLSPAWN